MPNKRTGGHYVPSNGSATRQNAVGLAFQPRDANPEVNALLKSWGIEQLGSAQLQLATFETMLAGRTATERKSDASSTSGRVVGVPAKIVFLVLDAAFVCGDFDVAFNGQLEAVLFTKHKDTSVTNDARKTWLRIIEAPENSTPEETMLGYSKKLGNMYWSGADLRIYVAQQKGLASTQEAVALLQRGFPGKVVEIDTRTYSIVDVFPGFSCPVCRFVFPSSELREAHQSRGGTCTTCGLPQACASVAHAHASAGAMLCATCKDGFACMGLLSQHLADQRCPCGARFHCAKQAEEHRRAKCDSCGTSFKCAKALDDHKKQGADKCASCGEQHACAGAAKQHAARSTACAVCNERVCEGAQLKHKSLHADKEWPALPTGKGPAPAAAAPAAKQWGSPSAKGGPASPVKEAAPAAPAPAAAAPAPAAAAAPAPAPAAPAPAAPAPTAPAAAAQAAAPALAAAKPAAPAPAAAKAAAPEPAAAAKAAAPAPAKAAPTAAAPSAKEAPKSPAKAAAPAPAKAPEPLAARPSPGAAAAAAFAASAPAPVVAPRSLPVAAAATKPVAVPPSPRTAGPAAAAPEPKQEGPNLFVILGIIGAVAAGVFALLATSQRRR